MGFRYLVVSIVIFYGLASEALTKDSVRVRLVKDLKTVRLSGIDLRFQQEGRIDPYTRVAIPMVQSASVTLGKVASGSGLFWNIQTTDSPEDSIQVYSDVLHIFGHRVKVGLEPVPAKIRLEKNRRGKIDAITELDIESYLAGVLPSEMPASWPLEALKAQAVASRTYMRKKMQERTHIHFDLEASVHDQVFKALNLSQQNPTYRSKIQRALRDTKNMVLKNKRGEYLTAYYHSDCGGSTESPLEVWGLHGFEHKRVIDKYCQNRSASKWRSTIGREEVARKLARHFGIFSEPKLESIFVSRMSKDQRVGDISVLFQGYLPKVIRAQDLRSVLGFDRLKSTRFKWHETEGEIKFTGVGNGHGVGLCQWGSRQLALVGKSYEQILAHYYPKATLLIDAVKEDILRVPKLTRDGVSDTEAKKMRVKSL